MAGAPHQNNNELLKTIDELNKEKQQIISIVSHDIKAPLTRISALVQLLNMDNQNFTSDQQQYLDKIHQVMADGLSMIRNLVDYRNIDYRGIEIHAEEIDLKQFIQSAVRKFKSLADKKNITLHIETHDDVTITSDNQCLTRIVDNLVSNAIKFSPDGKSIHVEMKAFNEHVEVRVRDEAGGFTAEDLTDLFSKFKKLTAKPTSGESSTGLGLYITKKMLDKISGTIVCETNEGTGTTFILTFPKSLAVP